VRRSAQDDEFVVELRKHEKIEKVTGSQGDDFVGVSKPSGRGHLSSFIHPTRKLVVIEIAASQQKQPDFVHDALLEAVNKLHRQKAPCLIADPISIVCFRSVTKGVSMNAALDMECAWEIDWSSLRLCRGSGR
jgi:hypothetical protein